MQKQLDISNSMVAFKHNREDKTTRLNLSNQIKLMDHQLDHRYRLALLVAQLRDVAGIKMLTLKLISIFILFLCVLLFFYIMALFDAGHYYTSLGFVIFILLFAFRLIYNS
ncbi:uncharacterized protein Bfra_009116 [Botrytis fragariae]|uniref:Uncharacterized protein n=1 Tax=Botrytis fragariae TaxID=1964551 RepID=A0A8H6EH54_9HELO|nr:uncharacterized protein Bfra_009116 [Botrytis fragariae]KAF5872087.1 hypothetical protein Bfra_009116 [Botrytis fragariae]